MVADGVNKLRKQQSAVMLFYLLWGSLNTNELVEAHNEENLFNFYGSKGQTRNWNRMQQVQDFCSQVQVKMT